MRDLWLVVTITLFLGLTGCSSDDDSNNENVKTYLTGDTSNALEFETKHKAASLTNFSKTVDINDSLSGITIKRVENVLNEQFTIYGIKTTPTHVIVLGDFSQVADENNNSIDCKLIALPLNDREARGQCITSSLLGGVTSSCGDGLGFNVDGNFVYFTELDSTCHNGVAPITYNKLYKVNPNNGLEKTFIYDFGPNTSSDEVYTNGNNFYVTKIALGGDMGTSGAYTGNPETGFTFISTSGSPYAQDRYILAGNSLTNQDADMLFKYDLNTNNTNFVSAPYTCKPGMNPIDGEWSWETHISSYWINGNALCRYDASDTVTTVHHFYDNYYIKLGLQSKNTVLLVGTPIHWPNPTTEYIMTKIDLKNDVYEQTDVLPLLGLATVSELKNYVNGIIIYGTKLDGSETTIFYNVDTDSIDQQIDDTTSTFIVTPLVL